MIIDFNKIFAPDSTDTYKKLMEEAIDKHDCYYCKYAQLKKRYDMGYYTGREPWCTLHTPPAYCESLNQGGQMCLFWELSDPDTRKV